MDFGKRYGYTFEHEATYDRMCLVNNTLLLRLPLETLEFTGLYVSTATHQTDDPKDTGAAVSTVSKQGSSAAIITATVIVTSTSCAASGITTTSAITSTIGSR